MADHLALQILISAKDGASAALRGVGRVLGDIRVQVAGLVASFGLLQKVQEGIGAAASLEDLRVQMAGLLGSSAAAEAKLKELNDAFGLRQVDAATALFVKLTAFGLRPTMAELRSLIDFSARTGKGIENLSEIATQLGQAWAKSKIQQEEALVLVERGVPVWELLSQVSGKTSAQLMAMAEKGELGRSAITALIAQMGKVADGASAARLTTWNGLVESAAALWKRFTATVAEGGVFQYAKDKLSEIAEVLEYAIQSGAARRWGEQIGAAVTSAGAWAEQLTGFVRQIVGGMQIVLNAAAAAINGTIALVTGSLARLADLVAGLPKLFWQAYPELKSGLDAFRQSAEATFQAASDRSREAIDGIQSGWGKINAAPGGGFASIAKDWQAMYDTAVAYNAEVAKSRQGAAAVAAELAKAKGQAQGLAGAMAGGGGGSGAGTAGSGSAAQPGGPDTYSNMTAEQLRQVRAGLNDRRAQALARYRAGQLTDLELGQINVDIGQEERLTRGLGRDEALRRQQTAAAQAAVPGLDNLIARVKIELDADGKAQVDAFKAQVQTPIAIPVKPMIAWGNVDLRTDAQLADAAKLATQAAQPVAPIPGASISLADQAATAGRQP